MNSLKRSDLNRPTQPGLRNQLVPADSVVIIHHNNRFAQLSPIQYTEMLLTLSKEASSANRLSWCNPEEGKRGAGIAACARKIDGTRLEAQTEAKAELP
jgi:hypothetical protein